MQNYKKRIRAISVDTGYQRVLALANKEQRGYITPQEFNLLSNQAQMTIFESYFYAKNLRDRKEPIRSNEVDETDLSELIAAKLSSGQLSPFRRVATVTGGNTFPTTVTVDSVAYDVFHTGNVYFANAVSKKIAYTEGQGFIRSPRKCVFDGPLPVYTSNNAEESYLLLDAGSTAARTSGVTVELFRVPIPVNWTYVVVNGKALYNGSDTSGQDFELHRSEEDTLVNLILALAGVTIGKPDLTQFAGSMLSSETQIQNQ